MTRPALLAHLLLAACVALPVAGRADVLDTVDSARRQGCGAPGPPLHREPRLADAAARLAGGEALHRALQQAGYLARQSSVIHLSGALGNLEVGRMLAAHDCAALTDPALTDVGAQRQGRDLWVVLAAPAAVPVARDAPRVAHDILLLVNGARAAGRRCGRNAYPPVAPLTMNPALTAAALDHSQDMAAHAEFEHQGHDGTSPSMRVTRAGYGEYQVVGENIAAGAMTAEEVMRGWLDSPAHCENIMDPRFTDIGIAFAVNPSSPELVYWTQDFALPRR